MSNENRKNEDQIHADIRQALEVSGFSIDESILEHDNGTTAHIAFEHDTTDGGRRKLQVIVSSPGTDDVHKRWFTERKAGFELDLIAGWIRTAFDKTIAFRVQRNLRTKQLAASTALCAELAEHYDDAPFELSPTEEGADVVAVTIPEEVRILMTREHLSAFAHLLNASGNYTPTRNAPTAPRIEAVEVNDPLVERGRAAAKAIFGDGSLSLPA